MLTLRNFTAIPDYVLFRDMCEVCRVMGWPLYDGTVEFLYLRKRRWNAWKGAYFFGGSGHIKLRYARRLFVLRYERKGFKIRAYGRRRCRQVGMVHELAHWQGYNEKDAVRAERAFLRRVKQ